jgi:pyruvate-ferredoxin/flavodoxin oxidoreductase
VNVLVLDTEVYSNTGGQQSKATPLGAAARFATAGKASGKKDLGLMAMTHRNVYVACIALGAKDSQTVRALREAESYSGPSLVIAYSPCIAHGYDLMAGPEHQKLMVQSGLWLLYRYDPRRADAGEPPLQLDSHAPTASVPDVMRSEARYTVIEADDPDRFRHLSDLAARRAAQRAMLYRELAKIRPGP